MDITTAEIPGPDRGALTEAWHAYRMRWSRRRLLARAWRKRGQLKPLRDRTDRINPSDVLVFASVRNEALRLPWFLDHYRKLGVAHFLFVDNDSVDGTADLLASQDDVSLWHTTHSYKRSRFGMDWVMWLLFRHGHGHWCLTVDADELLVYPDHETRSLPELSADLEASGAEAMGAVMIDLYPKGRLGQQDYASDQDPVEALGWFDRDNYTTKYQPNLRNLLIRGGVRSRVFFGALPDRVPTLSKTPLVRWNRRFAYVSSTHSVLPTRLNAVRGAPAAHLPSGALLHTKFLPNIVEKSREEKHRQEHFANSGLFEDYYDSLVDGPDLWSEESIRYEGWRQLAKMGLINDPKAR
ncbi:MAG: glycosyltransferase family 2 protein [Brevirhabdus sp.]